MLQRCVAALCCSAVLQGWRKGSGDGQLRGYRLPPAHAHTHAHNLCLSPSYMHAHVFLSLPPPPSPPSLPSSLPLARSFSYYIILSFSGVTILGRIKRKGYLKLCRARVVKCLRVLVCVCVCRCVRVCVCVPRTSIYQPVMGQGGLSHASDTGILQQLQTQVWPSSSSFSYTRAHTHTHSDQEI